MRILQFKSQAREDIEKLKIFIGLKNQSPLLVELIHLHL